MTLTILSLSVAYALVAALLILLLIAARVHIALKAVATLLVVTLLIVTYIGIGELRGLPSDGPIPKAFKLHWARVVEPNKLMGEAGHVFLWIEALDKQNYPSGTPRAYELPYDPELVKKVEVALGRIQGGEDVGGKVTEAGEEAKDTAERLAKEVTATNQKDQTDSTIIGERYLRFDPSNLSFSDLPAPVTPDKPQ